MKQIAKQASEEPEVTGGRWQDANKQSKLFFSNKGGEAEDNPRRKDWSQYQVTLEMVRESRSESESGEREVKCWAKIQSSQAEESRE